MTKKSYKIAADVGGTFTDIVVFDEEGTVWTGKVPSTPDEPTIGVMGGIKKAAVGFGTTVDEFIPSIERFVYGTTVATNTLLRREGLDLALIMTRGFRDCLNTRRCFREDGFDIRSVPPIPFVPRSRTYEVSERIDYRGNIIRPLVEDEVKQIAKEIKKADLDTVAVCLVFSFVNPIHERRVKELLLEEIPDLRVSISSAICPEIREYERSSTVAINAYLADTVERHFENLERELFKKGLKKGLQIMQSSGGVTTTGFIIERPVNIFLSGPAGGVVGASYLGEIVKAKDKNNFLTVDMGGTSFDICLLLQGRIPVATKRYMHGWDILAPTIDIHTIGAGGGSIAWVDIAGGLHVGPGSAGAVPGPACYMRGGEEATVTDADLVMGYLNPDYFLGGEMKLSLEKAKEAIKKLGDKIGLSPLEAADGIFRIVNNNMLGGMRVVTIGRGHDPRDYTLVVFGAAGAVHLPAFASELEIKHVIVPRDAAVFSSMGLTVSDIRFDFVKNINRNTRDMSVDELLSEYAALQKQAVDALANVGIKPEDMYFGLYADMKFPGEYSEFLVDIPAKINSMEEVGQTFIDYHKRLYDYVEEASPEIMNVRLSAFGKTPKPKLPRAKLGGENCEGAIKDKRNAYFHEVGKSTLTPIYDGLRIIPGNKLAGPAVIELPMTTIVVRPGQTLFMDELFDFNIKC